MKIFGLIAGLLVLIQAPMTGQAAEGGSATTSTVVARDRHFNVTESIRQTTNQIGQAILKTNRYTTIANGLNVKDAGGNWVESKPLVTSFPGGIVCTGASYSAIVGTNLKTGVVDFETSDKQRIVLTPLSIGFFDPESGRSVVLAQVKDCQAQVISNRIVFQNAFEGQGSGISASVTYTYGVGHWRQDITFVTRPAVTPADFSMGSRTRLEVMTEILQSPTPVITEHALRRETDSLQRTNMVEPDVIDQTVKFGGQMLMPLGHAFLSGATQPPQRGLAVAKKLLSIDGRTVLAESLAWSDAQAQLGSLPLASTMADDKIRGVASLKRQLPPRRLAQAPNGSFAAHLAEVTRLPSVRLTVLNLQTRINVPKGFMMDYEVVESATDVTFGSGTYFVPSQLYLDGTTSLSTSGTIIKYASFAGLNISDTISGSSFYSVIFTSMDDNSVGDDIDDSSGSPGYSAAFALSFDYLDDDATFGDLDFRYCYGALSVDHSSGHSVTVNSASFNDTAASLNVGTVDALDLPAVSVCNSGWSYPMGQTGVVSVGSLTGCDTDSDGLPDVWELLYFGSLSQTANGDYDGDGWTNLQEYQNKTDPTVRDQPLKVIITRPSKGSILP